MIKALAAVLIVAALGACANMGGAPTAAKLGGVLVNSAETTLCTIDKDVTGSAISTCNGPCAVTWPVLGAAEAEHVSGDWSIAFRDDGSKCWASGASPFTYASGIRSTATNPATTSTRSGTSSRSKSDVAAM